MGCMGQLIAPYYVYVGLTSLSHGVKQVIGIKNCFTKPASKQL